MSINVGEAAFSGFKLIGRRPLSVLVWGVVYLIAIGGPTLLFYRAALPAYASLFQAYVGMVQSIGHGAPPVSPMNNPAFMQAVAGMQGLSGFSWLLMIWGVVVRAVLTAAVLRAVIEPDNRGFFYLRLGMAEVWQALLTVAMFILAIVAGVALELVIVIPIMIGALMKSTIVMGIGVLIALVALVAAIWVALRLSLAAPLTFADKTFRLFESWKLTKGSAGALFLVMLILVVFIWIIEGVIVAGAFGIIGANAEGMKTFFAQPTEVWMKQATPYLIGFLVVSSLFSGAVLAIMMAPFANAYRQLRPATAQTFS